ncbi:MAG: ComEC/Rec2 family competence protein [Bacteroidales bacterium]|nr:ComEC/Rec2 family competence protein [Bacteroidales bacterium]
MLPLSEKIKSVPALKPLIAFALGVLVQFYSGISLSSVMIFSLTGVSLVFFPTFYFLLQVKKTIYLPAVVIYLSFILAGFSVSSLQNIKPQSPGKGIYIAEVVSLPVKKTRTTFLKLRLIADAGTLKTFKRKHFFHAYFSGNNENEWPQPGEIILFSTDLSDIKNPGNPNEFDYANYLARKNVYSSCFIKEGCWQHIGSSSKKHNIQTFALKIKEKLQQHIRQTAHSKGGLNYEVMLAICTGDKSELDRDLKTSYSQAGAIHVMAVSGLHVGMIWMFLSYLTFFLSRKPSGRIIQFFILIAVLWFYALLTGLSASVIRSCTMFTIASAANLLKRNKGIYNSVFIAALVQLTADPLLILDAGFQFSYTAVSSILLFQPITASIFNSRYIILRRIMELVSVSISAQILTFPLSVYYFHQFPTYFILTNVCVIPLVTLMMIGFLTSVLLIFIPAISGNLIFLSLLISELMNDCIAVVNWLPGSLIQNLNFSLLQIIILFLAALIFLRFLITRKFLVMRIILLLFIIAFVDGICNYKIKHRDSVCIFNVRGSTIIEIHKGKDHWIFYNDSLIPRFEIEYATSGYRASRYYNKPLEILSTDNSALEDLNQVANLPGSGNFIYFNENIKITVIQDVSILNIYKPKEPLFTDILIFGGKIMPSINQLCAFIEFEKVIISSSYPDFLPDLPQSDSLCYYYHRVSKHGAFVSNI